MGSLVGHACSCGLHDGLPMPDLCGYLFPPRLRVLTPQQSVISRFRSIAEPVNQARLQIVPDGFVDVAAGSPCLLCSSLPLDAKAKKGEVRSLTWQGNMMLRSYELLLLDGCHQHSYMPNTSLTRRPQMDPSNCRILMMTTGTRGDVVPACLLAKRLSQVKQ